MRIAIMGSGGAGGYYGGMLAQAGEDVTLIARGAHLDAIRANGLTIQSRGGGETNVTVAATDDPAAVGPVDLVLFCVKTYDLDAAAAGLAPLMGPHTLVLPIQNGIDAAERLAAYVDPEAVLGGVAYVVATRVAPGVIAHFAMNKIIFGERCGGTSARTETLRNVFARTGVTGELHANIRVPMWEKFILLGATGGVMALTRLSIGPIRDCLETTQLFRGVIEEASAVGRAIGIPLPENSVETHLKMVAGLDRASRSSMCNDAIAGRRLELESLNGTVVRLGRQAGIPTPLNFAVYAALKPYVNGPPPP